MDQGSAWVVRGWLLAIVASLAPAAWGDVLILRHGGRLEGQVRLETNKETGASYYLVQLADGSILGVSKNEVKAHLQESAVIQEYRQLAEKAGDSADAHWELSKWCRAKGLGDQWKRHIQRVVDLNSEHGAARAALGEVKYLGEWMPKEQMQRMRGLIYRNGEWQIPEAVVLNEESKASETNVRLWRTKIKRLKERINSPKFGAESLAELRAIVDPAASAAIAELALDEKESLTMRQLYLNLLSQWDTYESINALVALGLSREPTLREQALELVKQKAPQRGAAAYTALLRDANNRMVRQAAIALSKVPQPDSMLPLIDALVTTHKYKIETASGGMNPTFTSDGGGGLNMGGKPKIIEKDEQNQEVLSALLSLEPGVNYQFDEERWRAWYAQRAVYAYDLRRDP